MDYKMEIITLLFCVVPEIVTPITVYSNGNSPEVKLKGGIMVDVHKEILPVTSKYKESTVKNRAESVHGHRYKNSTKLSINERYRRLIPYMTFYYANDLAVPKTVAAKDVEIKKAQIIQELHTAQREPKKTVYSHQNIPRYQGNRITQHNIASANPIKLYYNTPPVYQSKLIQNYNPLLSEYKIIIPNDYDSGRFIPRQTQKNLSIFASQTRKPFLNLFNEDTANIQYYLSERDQSPKYKLVPYEQRPPVHTAFQHENTYDLMKKPVPISVSTPKDLVYLKPRPTRPHYFYDVNVQPTATRKQPTIVSEDYFEKQRPPSALTRPVIQSGFRPIVSPPSFTTEAHEYLTSTPETIISDSGYHKQYESNIATAPIIPSDDFKPDYYEYIVEQNTFKPPQTTTASTITLASLLDSLQLNKSIPRPITRENVGSSIKTLLQVLNALRAMSPETDIVEMPVLSTPTPFMAPKLVADIPAKSMELTTDPSKYASSEDLHEAPHLAQVNIPSQHLDDDPSDGGTSQQFPPPMVSDEEGGTPGRPGVDYPILTVIPQTKFSCKTQRYKGFFADPETRCQVWHYCDLNGGQASFLCPNGTVFSQAGLTCDWWFNVRCSSTTQLYVLNESLYKYILPHAPKFPEDYSGPLVDRYLTLKFKEMEEQFKKNKNKQTTDKMDSGEDSSEDTDEKDKVKDENKNETRKPSVIVESPGTSGKVERLEE